MKYKSLSQEEFEQVCLFDEFKGLVFGVDITIKKFTRREADKPDKIEHRIYAFSQLGHFFLSILYMWEAWREQRTLSRHLAAMVYTRSSYKSEQDARKRRIRLARAKWKSRLAQLRAH